MKFRPINVTRTSQLEQHALELSNALDVLDGRYADRHGDGPVQRLNARLYDSHMQAGTSLPDLPRRDLASLQSVRTFRPRTLADDCHPDARQFFGSEELAEVLDPAAERRLKAPEGDRHVSYVDNSQYEGLVGYQTESQEKAEAAYRAKVDAREKKKRNRAAAAGHKIDVSIAPEIDADEVAKSKAEAEKWKALRRTRAQTIIDRWQHGFHLEASTRVADEIVAPFSEVFGPGILRSHLSPSLARIPQLLTKLPRIGMDKAVLLSTTSKVLALDAPYIELDPTRLGCVIVELDTVWKSASALRFALLMILGPRMMPQIIVGRTTHSGQISRPHLIWLLNPAHVDADRVVMNGTVWNDPVRTITDHNGVEKVVGDPRCQPKPIRKFYAVQRSMVALLVPLGADPACHNINRPKNPLSPFMTAILPNEDYWPILSDFEQIPGYCRKPNEDALEEAAAKLRLAATGIEASTSNLVWKVVQNIIKPMARLALKTREADFLLAGRSTETLTKWFDAQVRPEAESELGPSETLDRVLARQCAFAARWCRSRKPGRRVARHRDRDLITMTVDDGEGGQRNLTAEERIQITAERSAGSRHAAPMWRLCKELVIAVSVTGSIDKTEFIKSLDQCSPSFAYKHWDEAVAKAGLTLVDGRFRDGAPKIKRSDYPSQSVEPSPASNGQAVSISAPDGHPTIDRPSTDVHPVASDPRVPAKRSETDGPPDPAWSTHAMPSAEPRPAVVSFVPEPA